MKRVDSLSKILIANRGEIAVRIIRACQALNLRTVAIYSEADAQAMHVRLADEAIPIGPPPPKESYLRGDKIIVAAKSIKAQAIHPGFGFLSENADFADAVRKAGLIFIGPTGDSIRRMGSKTQARTLMQVAGVPIVPGYQGQSDFQSAAEKMGYPILVKAAAGGGGKGMRIVHQPDQLIEAIEAAQREAEKAFGDATAFLEKYIEGARHIEFQVFGDAHGNVVHLFERECSTQRRHQKIIEETPSPLLDDDLREWMGQAAVAAARAVDYQNAGTIEFVVDPKTREFYFLEMNTRLQVEHPITELLTGRDLVGLQLHVAQGEALPFTQSDLTRRGHALECRIYAEDPAN
ncbi:MAG: ATP-grasp domain-containing protein, partial [Chloroflexi bacterium]|nr:ATP-grasp domain-containing protein [Chloroflexota bacterium]